jgi:hypothetical protein
MEKDKMEVVVISFMVLMQYLSGWTEEKYETSVRIADLQVETQTWATRT